MKKILVTRSDNGISIIVPTNEATPELLLRDAMAVNGYVSHREIEDSEIPMDRSFRNAWIDNDGITHDFDKCREIIRNKRNDSLTKLDKQAYAESRKPNGNITSINNEAQRLRDIPQNSLFNTDDINNLKTLLDQTKINI